MNKNNTKYILIAQSSLLLIGALMAVGASSVAPYVFGAGTLLGFVSAFIQARKVSTSNVRQKRMGRLHFVSALMLAFATYYLFIANNSWVVFLLIYAVTSLFLSMRNTEK